MRVASLLRTLRHGLAAAENKVSQQGLGAFTRQMSSVAAAAAEEPSSKSHMAAAMGGLMAGIFGASFVASADEIGDGLHSPHYPWPHEGVLDSFDHASIRRGHQVYQQVQDGPNDEGEFYTRPGRLSDPFPDPYTNEQAARYANGGAYPPDLSLISGARHNGQNYIFALLTGYRDPPAGVNVREGLYYNPYFPGGAIAMPKMLVDGGADYDDGTPSSASQQAKDVVAFLTWACYPFQDEAKVMGMKAVILTVAMIGFAAYSKRLRWGPLKSQRIVMDVVN